MKAKELMIGDYIVSELGNIYRVKGVRDLDGGEVLVSTGKADMWYDYRLIKPIPLTEDVLKANGYDEPDKNGFMCLESSIYRIYYNIHGYFCVHVSDGKVSSECTIWLDYVHELQHALRLCGLNNLADNFKVGGAE